MYFKYLETHIPSFQKILAITTNSGICDIILPIQEHYTNPPAIAEHNPEKFIALEHELDLYALGILKKFTIPLDIQGTPYQKKIWQILQTIPYGTTQSYKDIAITAASAPRAVGGANKKNRLPIIIPCHRVINHNSTLGGYFGGNVYLKQILLTHESNNIY
jgi:methylated-DNA-[protein]-cysteine S-methyltransferase